MNMVKHFFIVLKNYYRCYKNSLKRAIQKNAETTGDLIGNKIADKTTSISKKPFNNNNDYGDDDVELTTHKK